MVTTTQKLLKPLARVHDFVSRLRISWQNLHKFHPCEFILVSSWFHRGFIRVSMIIIAIRNWSDHDQVLPTSISTLHLCEPDDEQS